MNDKDQAFWVRNPSVKGNPMETKQIISWLRDKADRAHDLSWTRMMHKAADRLLELDLTQREAVLYWKPVSCRTWHLTCSVCDSHLGCREDAKFCPECGAKFTRYLELPEQPKEKGD